MNPSPMGVSGVSDMNLQNLEVRIDASLRRRLLAAPIELRAMATAEAVDWQYPEFETDKGQQEAVNVLLRACSDARAVIVGHRADDVWDDAEWEQETDTPSRQSVGNERLIALDRAIAAGVHAGRLLRQRGVKSTVVTRERIDETSGQTILERADLGFRRRSTGRRAA
jgi:hypothetical protein